MFLLNEDGKSCQNSVLFTLKLFKDSKRLILNSSGNLVDEELILLQGPPKLA